MKYLNVDIRPMTEKDLPSVLEIEALCFKDGCWKEKDLRYEMSENPVSNVWVIELSNDTFGLKSICGYCDYWNTFDSATIARIAVHPDIQHHQLGSAMMDEIINDCIAKRAITLTLEVRKSNVNAINFYKKHGFVESHIKKGYYTDGEDALYMILEVMQYAKNSSN